MAGHSTSADQDAFVLSAAEAGLLLAGPAAPQANPGQQGERL